MIYQSNEYFLSILACSGSRPTSLHHYSKSPRRVYRNIWGFVPGWIDDGMHDRVDHQIYSHQTISSTRIYLIYSHVIFNISSGWSVTFNRNSRSSILWNMPSTLHLQQFIQRVSHDNKKVFWAIELHGGKFHLFLCWSIYVYLSKT